MQTLSAFDMTCHSGLAAIGSLWVQGVSPIQAGLYILATDVATRISQIVEKKLPAHPLVAENIQFGINTAPIALFWLGGTPLVPLISYLGITVIAKSLYNLGRYSKELYENRRGNEYRKRCPGLLSDKNFQKYFLISAVFTSAISTISNNFLKISPPLTLVSVLGMSLCLYPLAEKLICKHIPKPVRTNDVYNTKLKIHYGASAITVLAATIILGLAGTPIITIVSVQGLVSLSSLGGTYLTFSLNNLFKPKETQQATT